MKTITLDSQVQEEFKSADFNVVATDATPELKQVKKLVRELHKHSLLKKALGQFIYFRLPPLLSLLT